MYCILAFTIMSILDFCGVFKCLDEKNNCFIINQIVTDIISLLYSVYKACHHFKLFKEQKIPKQKQKEFIDQVGFCDQNKEEHFRKIVEREEYYRALIGSPAINSQ